MNTIRRSKNTEITNQNELSISILISEDNIKVENNNFVKLLKAPSKLSLSSFTNKKINQSDF